MVLTVDRYVTEDDEDSDDDGATGKMTPAQNSVSKGFRMTVSHKGDKGGRLNVKFLSRIFFKSFFGILLRTREGC